MGSNFSDDLVRSEEAVTELLRWSGGAEEFSFDKYLISDSEVRWSLASSISRTLISFLSFRDLESEFLVEFVEVDRVLEGARGRDVAFRMDSEIRMVAFISEERRDPGSSTRSIVISKLRKRK